LNAYAGSPELPDEAARKRAYNSPLRRKSEPESTLQIGPHDIGKLMHAPTRWSSVGLDQAQALIKKYVVLTDDTYS
jgi:hypothetical protein